MTSNLTFSVLRKKTDGKNYTSADSDSELSVNDLQEMKNAINAMMDVDQNADIGAAISSVRNLAVVFRSLSFFLYSHVRWKYFQHFQRVAEVEL